MIKKRFSLLDKRLLFVLTTWLGGSIFAQTCLAEEAAKLKFRENLEQAPYIYRTKGNKSKLPQGYIPALLKYFMDDYEVDMSFINVPRNRVPKAFQQNKIDAAMLSAKWVDNPEDFVFSQPLALYRTVFIANTDNPAKDFINVSELKSTYICTHRGYVFPELDKYWESNGLIRVDFSDELLQLKGLLAERCQLAVMDRAVAEWYIKRKLRVKNLVIVGEEVTVPLTIGFRKDKAEYAALFDRTISRLKANGELKILQRVFGVVGD